MPSKKQTRNRRRPTRVVHTMSAPTMNGMQQVDTWNLLDLVPLSSSQQFDPAQPVFVEVFAGVNEWGYNLTQGNSGIGSGGASYGEATGQFQELQQLWSTYRIDSVTVEWQPAQLGAGYHSPIASCIDPAGATAPVGASNSADLIATFSRLRSLKLQSSLAKKARLVQDYRSWVMQTCPQTYLQTVDPASSTGARVFYPVGDNSTNPVLRMTADVALGPGMDARTPLGFLRVNARVTVRGRRGLPLSLTQRVAIMSPQEQRLIRDFLEQHTRGIEPLRSITPRR